MHHVTHVPWCMPGSITSGSLLSRWRGKRSLHSRRMHKPQIYGSGKRPMRPNKNENNFHQILISSHKWNGPVESVFSSNVRLNEIHIIRYRLIKCIHNIPHSAVMEFLFIFPCFCRLLECACRVYYVHNVFCKYIVITINIMYFVIGWEQRVLYLKGLFKNILVVIVRPSSYNIRENK